MGKKRVEKPASISSSIKKKTKCGMPSLAHMSAASSGGIANMVQPVKDEHVHLFLFYYVSKGSIFHPLHDDGPLVQMQMLCKANPSPIYKVQTMISLHGNQKATKGGKSDAMEESDAHIPVDLQEVEHDYGARFGLCR